MPIYLEERRDQRVTRDKSHFRHCPSRRRHTFPRPRRFPLYNMGSKVANNKPNKLAFLSMPAPASYVAGLGRGCVFYYSPNFLVFMFFGQCFWFYDSVGYWSCSRRTFCRGCCVSEYTFSARAFLYRLLTHSRY